MRMDKLTNQLQTALADAQSLALGKDHNFIEPVHLLSALLDQQGGSTRPLLQKAGANIPGLALGTKSTLSRPCPPSATRVVIYICPMTWAAS